MSTSTGRRCTRSTTRSSSSSVVGSIQCTSSYSASTGCSAASPASWSSSACEGPLLLPLRAERQRRVAAAGRDREQGGEQRRGLGHVLGAAGRAAPPACRACAPGGSSRAKPAARSSRPMTGWRALVWWKGEQKWLSGVCGSPPSRSRRARTRRDLPMPGSPASRTTWPSPSLACCQRSSSSASSCSRPTSGVRPAAACRASKRPSARRSPEHAARPARARRSP